VPIVYFPESERLRIVYCFKFLWVSCSYLIAVLDVINGEDQFLVRAVSLNINGIGPVPVWLAEGLGI
jgi:hypothetical protein